MDALLRHQKPEDAVATTRRLGGKALSRIAALAGPQGASFKIVEVPAA